MNTSDHNTLWARACEQLKARLHPDVYSRWISVIRSKAATEDALTLCVDNNFYQSWLEEHYVPLIRDAVEAASGRRLGILFEVGKTAPPAPEQAQDPQPVAAGRRPKRAPAFNPKFTFDDFVIGSANSFAHAAALAVAQAPARAYNPLFIYGGVGLGKTHLMQAIGQYVFSHSRAAVAYVSSEAFTNEYIDALQNRSLVAFRRKYRHVDVLLIDDIHFLANKEALQEEFFHTFNTLFDAHKQVVMTSDRPANDIRGLEQRLVSRFEWGLVAELEPPDFETRVAILKHNLKQRRLALADEIVLYIAHNVRSNVRRLEGALVRVLSYASLTGRPIDLPAAQHLLRDMVEREHNQPLSFDAIQRAVADHYKIRLADIVSARRPRAFAAPRQLAMYLCRKMTPASLPDIGNAFAKTHATVLHACRQVDARLAADPSLRTTLDTITQSLGRRLPLSPLADNVSASCSQTAAP